jgi:hypothetical protein
MRPRVQDGRPLVSGVVKAADQEQEIHGNTERPGQALLTPSQKLAIDRDEWPETEGAPGYEALTVTVRSDQQLAEEKRRHAVREASAPATAKPTVSDVIRSEAADISREVIAHGRQRVAENVRIMESGTPAEKRRVADDVSKTVAFVNQAKKVLGG